MCHAARAEAFPAPPLTRGAHIGTWGAARRWRDGCRVDAIRPCAGSGSLWSLHAMAHGGGRHGTRARRARLPSVDRGCGGERTADAAIGGGSW